MDRCQICGCQNNSVVYYGKIRDGGLGRYTQNNVSMIQCANCKVIWHNKLIEDQKEYYQTSKYRVELEGKSDEDSFYDNHDKESYDKFRYCGVKRFRNKVVADVGCGAGAFLDCVSGLSNKVVAIEPSMEYRRALVEKKYSVYGYMEEALADWKEKIDILVSFDVIEHVDDPEEFMSLTYQLLREGGEAIIGTPTDAPVMRKLLGDVYEKKVLFSVQHPWIFSKKSLELLANSAGFNDFDIRYFQRYEIWNLLGWLISKEPNSDVSPIFNNSALSEVWKRECEISEMADYIVIYAKK